MSEELKVCQCGFMPNMLPVSTGTGTFYHVVCDNCGIAEKIYRAEVDAKGAWNNRPLEDALRARIAELEAENAAPKDRLLLIRSLFS